MSESLHNLIAATVAESNLSDPRDIAAAVAQQTPTDMMERFYLSALTSEVRAVLSAQRNRAVSNAFNPPARSRKVSGIRDWWAEMLTARIHVGDSRWVTLGECGVAELAFAASERRADAAREIARAESYDTLRSLLCKHKVATVAELPADAARVAVRQVAA